MASTVTGATEGTERAPSRSTTATGPPAAPNGTRTSTDVLRRTDGAAAMSSASPSTPRNSTWSARESVFPRTRSTEPGRTAPAAPQRCAQASRATDAGLEATGTPPPAVTTGAGVGVGAAT